MELGKITSLLIKYDDFLLWLDVEFYACIGIFLVAALIAYIVCKKVLTKNLPILGKSISGIVVGGCIGLCIFCLYNIASYSKNKLAGCKALEVERYEYMETMNLNQRLKLSPEVTEALDKLDTLIRNCIEHDKQQGAGA